MIKRLIALLTLSILSISAAWAVPTDITPQTLKNLYSGAPAANALDVTLTAADVANGNSATAAELQLLLVQNSGASTYTFTITSVADSFGRTGDVSAYSLDAGEFACVPVPAVGFKQTTGKLLFSGNNAAVKFAVLRLP